MKARNSMLMMISLAFLFGLFGLGTLFTAVGNVVKPGDFTIGDPTLICLGFEWDIDGDDNRNAAVHVRYRKKGESGWKEALPV